MQVPDMFWVLPISMRYPKRALRTALSRFMLAGQFLGQSKNSQYTSHVYEK
jgi:hypothetical protein